MRRLPLSRPLNRSNVALQRGILLEAGPKTTKPPLWLACASTALANVALASVEFNKRSSQFLISRSRSSRGPNSGSANRCCIDAITALRLPSRRDDAHQRVELLEAARDSLDARVQDVQEFARSERESLGEYVRYAEDRAVRDVDHARQEVSLLQAQLAATIKRHTGIIHSQTHERRPSAISHSWYISNVLRPFSLPDSKLFRSTLT